MTRPDIEAAVITALSKTLRIPTENIQPDSDLESGLGLDSMAMIQVNIAVEEQLHVAVQACEAAEDTIRTVRDLVDFVAARVEAAQEVAPCC